MGVGAWLSGTEFAFLSNLGATGRTPYCECLFSGDFHDSMMWVCRPEEWSILTSAWGMGESGAATEDWALGLPGDFL